MQKYLRQLLFASLITTIAPICFAQSFFATTPVNSSTSPGKSTTLNDFQNKVRAMSDQNKDALNSELNQELAKMPPTSPATPPPSAMKPIETQTTTATTISTPTQVVQPPPVVPATTERVVTQAPAPLVDDGSGLGLPEATTSTTTVTTRPASPAQPQTYSGFVGTTNQNQNQTNTSTKSGGWNIKY